MSIESPTNAAYTIILTGSTGSLGPYLLDNLVQNKQVAKVYCLNRSKDGRNKQQQDSARSGLPTGWNRDRVVFLHVDLSKAGFGLDERVYRELLGCVTHVIHNQWPVNFNWPLSSFEPAIRSTRHLLDFCLAAPPPRIISFVFVSTVGTISRTSLSGAVPERAHRELVAELGGYSGAKLIAELIVDAHAERHPGQRASVCRLGQVAGPVLRTSGKWNSREWIPSVISSSKQLHLLPADLGTMNSLPWIPVDIAAASITEITLSETRVDPSSSPPPASANHASFYHVSNPHETRWNELVPTIAAHLAISQDEIVPWHIWVDALRRSESEAAGSRRPRGNDADIVGLKLLGFFESLRRDRFAQSSVTPMPMPVVETKRSVAMSSTLASLKPIGSDCMEVWLRQWDL